MNQCKKTIETIQKIIDNKCNSLKLEIAETMAEYREKKIDDDQFDEKIDEIKNQIKKYQNTLEIIDENKEYLLKICGGK